jgi:hypothetical protein
MGEAGFFAMFLAVGGIGAAMMLGPVGHALARRIAGRGAVDPATGLSTGEMAAERVADLEARLEELEAVHARMAELEERLDFTERLLARGAKVELPAEPGSPTPV